MGTPDLHHVCGRGLCSAQAGNAILHRVAGFDHRAPAYLEEVPLSQEPVPDRANHGHCCAYAGLDAPLFQASMALLAAC